MAAQHLEREPAAEFALEGEREPEPCQGVDEVEGVDAAEPDGPESDVRDQTVGDLFRIAFLGGVEEVGCDPVEDGVGEVLPAERVERADRMGAVGELGERVQVARALDVVAWRRSRPCPPAPCRAQPARPSPPLPGTASSTTSARATASGNRRRIGSHWGADAVHDLMAGGHPLRSERAANVSSPDHRNLESPFGRVWLGAIDCHDLPPSTPSASDKPCGGASAPGLLHTQVPLLGFPAPGNGPPGGSYFRVFR